MLTCDLFASLEKIEPAYGIEPTLHRATLPVSRRVEEQTWDAIDRTVSEPYYDIQDVTTEQVEHEGDPG